MSSPMSSTFAPSQNYSLHDAIYPDELGFAQKEGFINHLSMNPTYSMQNYFMHPNPAMHHIHGSSLMTEKLPFYHQAPSVQYYHQGPIVQQLNQGLEDPIVRLQPEQQQLAVQPQQRVEEEVLVVRPERPLFGVGKARLHWTQELHARFVRAVSELGGCFSATPKAISKRMNVKGLTLEQIKSHLQKVRLLESKKIKLGGVQKSLDSRSVHLSKEGSSNALVNGKDLESFGADIEAYGKLLQNFETPIYYQNQMFAAIGNNQTFQDLAFDQGR